MPVEFSVAAYRFGHSMIRPIYRLNETVSRREIFGHLEDAAGDLGGMRSIPSDWAIDWQFFVDLGAAEPDSFSAGNDPIGRQPQFSYKIDTSLVSPLGHLPPVVAADPSVLALRNLQRGVAFELPTGEQIADKLGLPVLAPSDIRIGKATVERDKPSDPLPPPPPTIGEINSEFAGATPLWAYVLAEAQATSWNRHPELTDESRNAIAIKLGPVGGHLVAETIAWLLWSDASSFVRSADPFKPIPEFTDKGTFGVAQLLQVVLGLTPSVIASP